MSLNPQVERGQNSSKEVSRALLEAVTLDSFTVAGLPDPVANARKIIFVSNGAGGSACLAYSNGANWLRIVFGQPVNVAS
jgi:hypothetical protein